jgi:precorrin-3B synthase
MTWIPAWPRCWTKRHDAARRLSEPRGADADGRRPAAARARRRLGAGDGAGHRPDGEAFGNGVVEITARGNLQIRGLRPETAAPCAEALIALGIADAPPVMIGPLAGRDPLEFADPRGIAAAIAAGWPEGLAAKTSVVVDGGGALHLDAVAADLRLVAVEGNGWLLLRREARWLARLDAREAAEAVLRELRRLGPRRGREVAGESRIVPPPARAPAEPIGWHAAGALGVAGAFGTLDAPILASFAQALPPQALLRPAPGRALLALGIDAEEGAALRTTAARLGLVTDSADPRRRIAACPGRPACASAEVETRPLAAALAELPELPGTIHVSGCAKGCAHPGPAAITLVGRNGGFGLIRAGGPGDLPACHLAPGEVAAALRDW